MKSTGRVLTPLTVGTWSYELDLVTGIPFSRRPDVIRSQQQLQISQRPKRGLFRVLLCIITISVASTILATWYLQHELPVAQKRAKESEALLAPPSPSFCRRTRPPLVCAHGGDTTSAPANTVPAFRAALAGGADCVEIDAALSRDGVLVVMHVRELAILLGRDGMQVGDLNAGELLALRWPGSEAVMSVAEAVELTAPFVSCVTLDVKTYNDKSGSPLDELAIAEALVELVASTGCSNCLIWAKSDAVVRRVLQLSPGQRTGYIVMNETEESRRLGMHHPLRFNHMLPWPLPPPSPPPPSSPPPSPLTPHAPRSGHLVQPAVVGVHWGMVGPPLLQELHGAGKQLFAWTINQAEVLRAVLDTGVDGLVTNYPLIALQAIDVRLAKCGAMGPKRPGAGGAVRGRSRGTWSAADAGAMPQDGDYL